MNETFMSKLKKATAVIRNLCWWSAGIVPSVLEKCPTNHGKYTAIGVIMGFIACLASISFAFFLSSTFAIPFIIALFGGLLWGSLIFNLDRVVLTSFRKDETSKISIIQRFILTIALSLIISEPLLMHLFRKEIALEMAQKSQTVLTDSRQNAAARFQIEKDSLEKDGREIQARLDVLKADRDEKEKAVIGEVEGTSGSGKRGEGIAAKQKDAAFKEADAKLKELKAESAVILSQNNTRLAEIHAEIENETKRIAAANSEADGVLAKHEALFNIIKTQPGAAFVYIPLFIGLLLLETLPLSVKVFGKKSVYDFALEAEEDRQMSEFDEDRISVSAEKKRLRDLQDNLSAKIFAAILNDKIENQVDANMRELAAKIKFESLRRIENTALNRQSAETSRVKFGEEIAVEVVGQDDLQVKLQLPGNVLREISLQELGGDIQTIADEIGEENLKLAKAFSSKGHEIWKDLPLLPQLESDQKLILQFEPV